MEQTERHPPMPQIGGVRHRVVATSGLRVHVAEAGSGEPLVLLHTSFEHWYAWRHLIPVLAAQHRVICPDMRGCGWSDAPPEGYEKERLAADVVGLLDALGLERAGLIGHGMGGLVGFLVALSAPERVSRYLAIGILHPWLHVDPRVAAGLWRSWYQPLVAAPAAGPWAVRRRPLLRWLLRGTSPHPDAWLDEDIETYAQVLDDPARARAVSLMYRTFLTREFLPLARGRYGARRLRVPTLLLFGTNDAFFSAHGLRGYEPYVDDMRVELLEREGHFVHEERAELVAARAERFFEAGS